MTKFQSCLDLIKCKGTFYGSKVGDGTKGVDGGGVVILFIEIEK